CKSVEPDKRVWCCGRRGLTKRECLDKGCCYDLSIPGAVSCFNTPDNDQTCSHHHRSKKIIKRDDEKVEEEVPVVPDEGEKKP
ncbi:hypothetical protein NDU88_001116, partial [Pleurodeles waltl]